ISVGIYVQLSGESIDLDDIIKAADDALYTSKREGKNRVTLHSSIESNSEEVA
ncbi:MAG: diguanylate cyclase, partial [Bacilli bacterium]|nr:diguanylate cyclase [Bacilli bacterium]